MTRLATALALSLALLPAVEASAQTPAVLPPPAAPRGKDVPLTPLEVQVVITRLDRGKVVSTLPYTLSMTTNAGEAQLNMGTEVPVPTAALGPMTAPAPTPPSGATAPTGATAGATPPPARPMMTMTYRPVGTIITCRAVQNDGSERVQLVLSVDDSAIFTSGQAAPPVPVGDSLPVFRSFRSRNTLMMSDGQTRQYTAASDRVSGEIVRLEVTMRVVK